MDNIYDCALQGGTVGDKNLCLDYSRPNKSSVVTPK